MLKKFKSIFYILNKDQKNSFFFLLFLMITTSFLEILSIVVLLDFVNFFIMSENSNYFSVVTKFAEKFNINFISEDIFQRGLITIIFLLLSIIFALLEIYFSVKFAFKTGGEIESRLFEYYLKRDYLFHIETSSANLLNRINELVKRITLFVCIFNFTTMTFSVDIAVTKSIALDNSSIDISSVLSLQYGTTLL